jgi:hypothetical protein
VPQKLHPFLSAAHQFAHAQTPEQKHQAVKDMLKAGNEVYIYGDSPAMRLGEEQRQRERKEIHKGIADISPAAAPIVTMIQKTLQLRQLQPRRTWSRYNSDMTKMIQDEIRPDADPDRFAAACMVLDCVLVDEIALNSNLRVPAIGYLNAVLQCKNNQDHFANQGSERNEDRVFNDARKIVKGTKHHVDQGRLANLQLAEVLFYKYDLIKQLDGEEDEAIEWIADAADGTMAQAQLILVSKEMTEKLQANPVLANAPLLVSEKMKATYMTMFGTAEVQTVPLVAVPTPGK